MSTAPRTESLLTVEEFGRRPDPGHPEELVRGRIESMPPPKRRHGQVCNKVGRILGNYAEEHDLGHVLNNDAGVITGRDPDTLRGPDVAYYSYARLPKGPLAADYGPETPELIFEVLSPEDRWPKVVQKVAEYLNVGVLVVGVLDPDARTLHLFSADRPMRILNADDELTLPELLGAFRVVVGRFFE